MTFLSEYGLFLAETATFTAAALLIIGAIASACSQKRPQKGKLVIKSLNEKYHGFQEDLSEAVLPKKNYKQWLKQQKKNQKLNDKNKENLSKNIYVLRFEGDIQASAVEKLREEITAVLSVAQPKDEVVCLVESAGGLVHSYGLAAAQLLRIKEKNIPLTVSVDKIAASGGYLMACVANKILAAPFAIIGSIGVVAQMPNFNRWLKKNNIDFEQVTAGEYKRTLTLFGENTEKAREKMKQDLQAIHDFFKAFIAKQRPDVDLIKTATGEHWLAADALSLGLVDVLQTSDDYLFSQSLLDTIKLFEIDWDRKKRFSDKLYEKMNVLKLLNNKKNIFLL